MAVQPFPSMPTAFTAGDTLSLLLSAPNFPADQGWTITVKALIPGTSTVVTLGPSSNSSGLHAISATATATGSWTTGAYHWQARAAKGSEVYTLAEGDIQILPALVAGLDGRSFAAKMLAQVEAALLALGSDSVVEYKIGDREARRYSRMDLLKERAFYSAQVRRERGQPVMRVIPTAFQSGKTIVPEPGTLDFPFV